MELVQTVVSGGDRGSRVQILIDPNHSKAVRHQIEEEVDQADEKAIAPVFPVLSRTVPRDRSSQICMDRTYTLVRTWVRRCSIRCRQVYCSSRQPLSWRFWLLRSAFRFLISSYTFPVVLFQTRGLSASTQIKSCTDSLRIISLELIDVLI